MICRHAGGTQTRVVLRIDFHYRLDLGDLAELGLVLLYGRRQRDDDAVPLYQCEQQRYYLR